MSGVGGLGGGGIGDAVFYKASGVFVVGVCGSCGVVWKIWFRCGGNGGWLCLYLDDMSVIVYGGGWWWAVAVKLVAEIGAGKVSVIAIMSVFLL